MSFVVTSETFTQLLIPLGVVPSLDFAKSNALIYAELPGVEAREKIRFILGSEVVFSLGSPDEVERLVRHWRATLTPDISDAGGAQQDLLEDDEQLKDLAFEAPVIRMVNHLLERALDLGASDIHFEPEEEHLDVRCRVDGIMTKIERLPVNMKPAVSSRLKLMARLDIGEKRLPQDGRIQYSFEARKMDMRMSTLPGVWGESIVLRILDRSDVLVDLSNLGIPEQILNSYQDIIKQPHGMVLITGPTGSGKTTTLYATLDKINSEEMKIITVEDPVEYQLPGVTQIQVNTKIGLSFASGLRSIVRQDPDIIMIGEIRDKETAGIAIESALTGHLVFSTLHTNDAASAITRLQDIGIESFLISSSLLGIMAQRLVRCVCARCALEQEMSQDEASLLDVSLVEIPFVTRGRGCEHCAGTGYRGRVGLYELLVMDDTLRHLVTTGGAADQITGHGLDVGLQTLRQDGLCKLVAGQTTPSEILRVTRSL